MLDIAGGILLAYIFIVVTMTGFRHSAVMVESSCYAIEPDYKFNPPGVALMLAPSALLLWLLFF